MAELETGNIPPVASAPKGERLGVSGISPPSSGQEYAPPNSELPPSLRIEQADAF